MKVKIADNELTFRKPTPDEMEFAVDGKDDSGSALRRLAESCSTDREAFNRVRKEYPGAGVQIGDKLYAKANAVPLVIIDTE